MFVVLDCTLVHNGCIACVGEGEHDCLLCSDGYSRSTDGSCFGKKERKK